MGKIACRIALLSLLPGWLLAAPLDDLVDAARDGDTIKVEALVAAGADLNAWTKTGACALHAAVAGDQPGMVKWLLAHGANPNRMGNTGYPVNSLDTPLAEASRVGSMEMVRMLLQAGADLNALDDKATQVANLSGNIEVFQYLQSIGGKVWPDHPVPHRSASRTLKAPPTGLVVDVADTNLGARLLPSNPTFARRPGARARVAIIADSDNTAIADLVFAELANAPDLELVERAELHRIITEQNLSPAFAASQANYGQLAGLLKADALLLINHRKLGDKNLVEARLLQTNPGVVLDTRYCPAPVKDASTWAKDLAEGVRTLATRTAADKGIAVSLVNLRASLGTAAAHDLEDTLTLLLSQRLIQAPGVHVLERSEMDRLVREQPIAESRGFWTAAWIVDGTIDLPLDGSGTVNVKLELRPAGGGAPRSLNVRGSTGALGELRENLAQQILRALAQAAPSNPFPAQEEAARYLREARWALDCDLPEIAYRTTEAAWALGDHSIECARVRITSAVTLLAANHKSYRKICGGTDLWDLGDPFHHPARQPGWLDAPQMLDLSCHVLDIYQATLKDFAPWDAAASAEWLLLGDRVMRETMAPGMFVNTAQLKIEHADRLQAWREKWKETMEAVLAESAKSEVTPALHAARIQIKVRAAPLWVLKPANLLAFYRGVLHEDPPTFRVASRLSIRLAIYEACPVETWQIVWPDRQYDYLLQQISPRQWKALSQELQAAGSADDRLLGWMLQRGKRTFSMETRGTDSSEATMRRILDGMWELRKEFTQDPKTWMEWLKATNLSGAGFLKGPGADHGNYPELVAYQKKVIIWICHEGDSLLDVNWIPHRSWLSEEDLAELRAALEVHYARSSTQKAFEKLGPRYLQGYQETIGRFVAGPFVHPAGPPPLEVTRFWRPPDGWGYASRPVWAENRIWLLCSHPSSDTRGLFIIDPDTFEHSTIPLPQDLPPHSRPQDYARRSTFFVVTPRRILMTREGLYFAVYDRKTTEWQCYNDFPADGFPVPHGEECYFRISTSDSTAIVRFDFAAKKGELIANTRRQPSESPLDEASVKILGVQEHTDGRLVIYSEPKVEAPRQTGLGHSIQEYLWAPDTGQWEKRAHRIYPTFTVAPGFFPVATLGTIKPPDELPSPTDQKFAIYSPQYKVKVELSYPTARSIGWLFYVMQCPRGIVIPNLGGAFGFIPQKAFDAYTAEHFPNVAPGTFMLRPDSP